MNHVTCYAIILLLWNLCGKIMFCEGKKSGLRLNLRGIHVKKKPQGRCQTTSIKKKHVSFSWIQEMICSQSLLSKPKRKIMLLPRALISITLLQVSITLILLPFPEAHLNWCPIFLNLNSLQETMCNKCFTKATGDSRNFIIQFPRYQHNISV